MPGSVSSLRPYFPASAVILDHAASPAKRVIEGGERGGYCGLGTEDARAEGGFGEAGGEGGVALGICPATFGANGEDGSCRIPSSLYCCPQRWRGARFGEEKL